MQNGARRLVLLGRQPLPARASWKQELKSDSAIVRRIAAVLELEAMGASVHLEAVDLGKEDEVAAFVRRFEAEAWPPIKAVFHAAGVIEDSLVIDLERTLLTRILRPKVWGTHWLLKHLDPLTLQRVVFFSSASTLLGSRGSSGYTAANAFLDGMAWSLRAKGVAAFSVNWGPWENVGMAERGERGKRLSSQGIAQLVPASALEALEYILSHEMPETAVLSMDWRQYFQENVRASATGFLTHLTVRDPLHGTRHPTGGLEAKDPSPPLSDGGGGDKASAETQLKALVGEVLKISPSRLEAGQRLSTVGLDSIMAVQIRHEIELLFGAVISIQDIAQSSIAELVGRVGNARVEK